MPNVITSKSMSTCKNIGAACPYRGKIINTRKILEPVLLQILGEILGLEIDHALCRYRDNIKTGSGINASIIPQAVASTSHRKSINANTYKNGGEGFAVAIDDDRSNEIVNKIET